MMALACDLRYGTANTKTAFLFTRVGLAGADMGACALLPRVIGQGRASELLFTGRAMTAQEGLAWGFFNALHEGSELLAKAQAMAGELAAGPTFAHGMTKTMLQQEWAMTIEQAIEANALHRGDIGSRWSLGLQTTAGANAHKREGAVLALLGACGEIDVGQCVELIHHNVDVVATNTRRNHRDAFALVGTCNGFELAAFHFTFFILKV